MNSRLLRTLIGRESVTNQLLSVNGFAAAGCCQETCRLEGYSQCSEISWGASVAFERDNSEWTAELSHTVRWQLSALAGFKYHTTLVAAAAAH